MLGKASRVAGIVADAGEGSRWMETSSSFTIEGEEARGDIDARVGRGIAPVPLGNLRMGYLYRFDMFQFLCIERVHK